MPTKYWLDLFTGKTWEEFLRHGGDVSGYRARRRNICGRIRSGDYLICYLTGISRFIGVLEVVSDLYIDSEKIWENEDFPCRFKVKVVCKLDAKTAIPVNELWDKLSIFRNLKSPKSWTGFFRGSPNLFNQSDGEALVEVIQQAVGNPKEREFDEKKYWRQPKTFKTKVGVITVPEERETEEAKTKGVTHEEIQWLLLKLGSDLGLDVWVARNDRNKNFNGKNYKDIGNLRTELPRQFDDATNRTVELIDVLWLQGDAIVAAFEVEHTTAIYSGILRMADLVTMQPNIRINLYLVAPDERREKVIEEINRPTFSRPPLRLPKICKFIPYSELRKEVDQLGYRVKYMKSDFIDGFAESCEVEST